MLRSRALGPEAKPLTYPSATVDIAPLTVYFKSEKYFLKNKNYLDKVFIFDINFVTIFLDLTLRGYSGDKRIWPLSQGP
jgi:hypothetical protein